MILEGKRRWHMKMKLVTKNDFNSKILVTKRTFKGRISSRTSNYIDTSNTSKPTHHHQSIDTDTATSNTRTGFLCEVRGTMAQSNSKSTGAPSESANKQHMEVGAFFDIPYGPKDFQEASEGDSHEDGQGPENKGLGSEGNRQPNGTSQGTHYGLESFMQQAASQFTLTYASNMSDAARSLQRHQDLLQEAAEVEAQAEQTVANFTTWLNTIRNQAADQAAALRRQAQDEKETVENLTRMAVIQRGVYKQDTISAAKGLARDGIPVSQLTMPSVLHPDVMRRSGSVPAGISREEWASLNSWSGLSKDQAADLVSEWPSRAVPGDEPAASQDVEAIALAAVQATDDHFLTSRTAAVGAPPTTEDRSTEKHMEPGNSTSGTT